MDRRHLLQMAACLPLFGTSTACSRAPAERLSDVEVLRLALSIHPGVYRYAAPDEVERGLTNLEPVLGSDASLEQQYLQLTAFLATLRCGHTVVNPFNQSEKVRDLVYRRPTRLPFLFKWLGSEMVVTDAAEEASMTPGTVVLSIDGVPAGAMLERLVRYVGADGGNDGKRRAALEVQGRAPFETFDILQGLLYPPENGAFDLRVRGTDGSERALRAPAISAEQRLAILPPEPENGEAVWTCDEDRNGIGTLTMPNWALFNTSWDWRGWLSEKLDRALRLRGMVVDIRGVGGGLSCGDPILRRLMDEDIVLDDYRSLVRFQRSPQALDPYIFAPWNGFKRLGRGAPPIDDGFYDLSAKGKPRTITPVAPRLTIPTAVLVDAMNSSATFTFARHIKAHGLARLFGSETGGNLKGINAGAVFFVTLPDSGLTIDLPLIGQYPVSPQADRGVLPDSAVYETAADIAEGKDVVLASAKDWILTDGQGG
ncbi:S41 family peptidase [Parvularcula maris]|uniref:S41 family peptidase n=1 Tax=Parvularcula maris TaxID=2965077 RepID=A0A9X2L9I2_9PROT|nr:S41 family peptidase [Parvularcula maris]MCQ8184642.1 S41 family peptidase [Parvularcula maris]